MKVNFLRSVHNVKFIVKEDEGIVIALVEKDNKGNIGVPTKLIEALNFGGENMYATINTAFRWFQCGASA